MRVPLSTFSQFVGASPSIKLNAVQTLKAGQYDPRHDYWKKLREFIPRNHQNGGTKADLEKFVRTITSNRAGNYALRVQTYKTWWGRHSLAWRNGHSETWASGRVEVNVNPELFLVIDGEPHVIKLYFNKDRIAADRANTVLRLLEISYRKGASPTGRPHVGVLDLGQGTLITPAGSLAYLDPVLTGEAAALAAIWNSI